MRARSAVAVSTVLLTVVGCSGGSAGEATSAAPSSQSPSPTPSATPTPVITIDGADDKLTAAVAKVYKGRTGVEADLSVGTWGKEKVAVVTSGDDVTLAVGPKWKVVGGWWPSLGNKVSGVNKKRFLLVVGSDSPKESLKGSRGDTLQVVALDGKGGGGIVGIPRDLYVPLATGGSGKINAAFAFGGGKAQLETVKNLSGLPIEGYAVTGFSGFRKIVNESGGLPITLKASFRFLGMLDVKKGKQTVDGNTALAYARERKSLPDGDFGRSRHQQEIILAAAVAARLAGPEALPKLMTTTSKHIETDLSASEALTFFAAFYRVDPRKMDHTVAQGSIGTADGQSVVKVTSQTTQPFRKMSDGRL